MSQLIDERGLDGVTCRAVTDRAGVAAGTFFVHFADSASLGEVLLDDHLAAALTDIEATLPTAGGLADELLHVSLGLVDSYAGQPALARAYLTATLFRADLDGPTSVRLRSFARWVGGRVATAVARGELEDGETTQVAGVYFGLYFGTLVAGLRGEVTCTGREEALEWALRRLVGTPDG